MKDDSERIFAIKKTTTLITFQVKTVLQTKRNVVSERRAKIHIGAAVLKIRFQQLIIINGKC